MKKILIILVAFLVSFAWANTDLYNIGTAIDLRTAKVSSYANCVGVYETENQVTIVFKATWVDSSDQLHSKPIFIGDLNAADGYTVTITSAASDVNPIFHFSYDNTNTWVTTTPAGLDAVSSTAVEDTIGHEAGSNDIKFHYANWLVIEYADGSTALNDDEYCTMVLTFVRDGTQISGYEPRIIQRVRSKSETNP